MAGSLRSLAPGAWLRLPGATARLRLAVRRAATAPLRLPLGRAVTGPLPLPIRRAVQSAIHGG